MVLLKRVAPQTPVFNIRRASARRAGLMARPPLYYSTRRRDTRPWRRRHPSRRDAPSGPMVAVCVQMLLGI